jgi:ketosteroid isomerase-like protein
VATNKEIVQQVNDGFATGDVDLVMSHIADDVRWDVVGISTAIGKDAFRKEVKNENFEGVPEITVHNAIEEGDRVAVEGEVSTRFKGGAVVELFFHNAYRLEGGKVKELRSYLVFKGDVDGSKIG